MGQHTGLVERRMGLGKGGEDCSGAVQVTGRPWRGGGRYRGGHGGGVRPWGERGEGALVMDDLWAELRRAGGREARDRLIVHYSPLVEYVAGRMSARLPDYVEQADLVSYGTFGLINAVEKFDPSRGLKFETYAVFRIRGAIMDELRRIDWVPRSVRAKARGVDRACANLEARLLRAPSDAEIAGELGITDAELQQLFSRISLIGLLPLDGSLSTSRGERGESTTLGDTIADPGQGPMMEVEVEETKHDLASSIDSLADRGKTVLVLYYYEGLTLAQIGEVLGVTESRICQIHGKAILQLRSRMTKLRETA
jgi:RNA polymerase sigma factor for flagellar operon FliA